MSCRACRGAPATRAGDDRCLPEAGRSWPRPPMLNLAMSWQAVNGSVSSVERPAPGGARESGFSTPRGHGGSSIRPGQIAIGRRGGVRRLTWAGLAPSEHYFEDREILFFARDGPGEARSVGRRWALGSIRHRDGRHRRLAGHRLPTGVRIRGGRIRRPGGSYGSMMSRHARCPRWLTVVSRLPSRRSNPRHLRARRDQRLLVVSERSCAGDGGTW